MGPSSVERFLKWGSSCLLVALLSISLGQSPSAAQQPAAILSSGGNPNGLNPSPSEIHADSPFSNSVWTSNAAESEAQSGLGGTYGNVPLVTTASAQEQPSSPSGLRPQQQVAEPPSEQTKRTPLKLPSAAASRSALGSNDNENSTWQMLVSVFSSLLIVIGLFLGVAWCYRKTLSSTIGGSLPKQVVSILGRTSISARQQVVLLRFGSKLVLVSVIQGEARTLSEISDPLEVDQLSGICESSQPGSISNSFKSVLLNESGRR